MSPKHLDINLLSQSVFTRLCAYTAISSPVYVLTSRARVPPHGTWRGLVELLRMSTVPGLRGPAAHTGPTRTTRRHLGSFSSKDVKIGEDGPCQCLYVSRVAFQNCGYSSIGAVRFVRRAHVQYVCVIGVFQLVGPCVVVPLRLFRSNIFVSCDRCASSAPSRFRPVYLFLFTSWLSDSKSSLGRVMVVATTLREC